MANVAQCTTQSGGLTLGPGSVVFCCFVLPLLNGTPEWCCFTSILRHMSLLRYDSAFESESTRCFFCLTSTLPSASKFHSQLRRGNSFADTRDTTLAYT